MVFRLLVLLQTWLFLAIAHAAPVVCTDLLTANRGHSYALEQQILSSVTPDTIDTSGVRSLSKAVYLLPLKDGNQVVLRISRHESEAEFEAMASRFIQKAPGGNTPSVRLLRQQELRAIMPAGAQAGSHGTLAVYFSRPAEAGRFYLEDHVATMLRSGLAEFAKSARGNANFARSENWRKQLRKAWSESTAEGRASVVEDLRKHFPEVKGATEDEVLESFFQAAPGLINARLDNFEFEAWQHLPPEVRTQLADHWTLYTILAIPDFHYGNWLIHSNQVLAIDAALRSRWFATGSSDIKFPTQQSPIDGGTIAPSFRTKMIKATSPELITYLNALTAKDVFGIAKEAGYNLTEVEARGILGRINTLVKARRIALIEASRRGQ